MMEHQNDSSELNTNKTLECEPIMDVKDALITEIITTENIIPLESVKINVQPEGKKNKLQIDENYKGYAFIFNQDNFIIPKYKRNGTRVDGKSLHDVLNSYGIYVDQKYDLTLDEIKEEILKLKNIDFGGFECFIIAIFTHGKENNQLLAKDVVYNLYETIVNPINDNETLKETPKIYLIQACKGSLEPCSKMCDKQGKPLSSNPIGPTKSIKEMFIAFSTYEGFDSIRNPNRGGIFIQSFCKILREFGKEYTIDRILQSVTAELVNKNGQVSSVFSTLTRPFIFGDIGQRGYGIIFNLGQMKFNGDILTQCGTRKDVEIIKEMCNKYKITVWDDKQNEIKQTLQQITDTVDKFKSFDFNGYDFLIIPIITFVSDHNLIHAYDDTFSLYDTIIEPIYNNKTLEGKPIVILVEALKFPIEIKFNIPIPDLKNMYFAFSTYDGYHDVNLNFFGGVFLHKLCKEIDNTGHIKSINEIMESVSEELCIPNRPILKNTLTRQFFLGSYA